MEMLICLSLNDGDRFRFRFGFFESGFYSVRSIKKIGVKVRRKERARERDAASDIRS